MPRTPAPAALKLVGGRGEGRDSGGRVVPPPPKFRRLPPNPPTWLSREAAAEWRRVTPELTRLGLIKEADRAALSAYCEAWSRYVRAIRLTHGETVINEGQPNEVRLPNLLSINSQGLSRHPAVQIAEAAAKELRGWCAEFGLTPSAEGRVSVKDDGASDDENPFG